MRTRCVFQRTTKPRISENAARAVEYSILVWLFRSEAARKPCLHLQAHNLVLLLFIRLRGWEGSTPEARRVWRDGSYEQIGELMPLQAA